MNMKGNERKTNDRNLVPPTLTLGNRKKRRTKDEGRKIQPNDKLQQDTGK